MRQAIAAIAALVALLLVAAPLGSAEARVLETDGRVEIRTAPEEDWQDLEAGTVVPIGATISTGFDAGALIEVGPEALLEVDALTRLTLEELIEEEGLVESDLHLSVGSVRGDVDPVEDVQTEFELSSPVATAAVRGTSFEFDGVNLQTFAGRVELSNRFNQRVTVRAGERSSTTGEDIPPSGDVALERDTTVSIYTAGVEDREESLIRERESEAAALRIDAGIEEEVFFDGE